MKYVLIKPDRQADILFFKGITITGETEMPVHTAFLSNAHVFEYEPEVMQYALDSQLLLAHYSAIPIADVDIFKAKLAGK